VEFALTYAIARRHATAIVLDYTRCVTNFVTRRLRPGVTRRYSRAIVTNFDENFDLRNLYGA
jgi:hypothetical protein